VFCLDTICTVSLYDGGDQSVLDGALALCEYYEGLLSRTVSTSDISRINSANGAPVEVSDETAELLGMAVYYSELSGGLFDCTIGACSALWDFRTEEPSLPDSGALSAAVSTVGWKNLLIDGSTVTLTNPDTRLDLGAIAKGYIADRVADYLAANGVTSAIIDLGGNIVTMGEKEGGLPWRVGIRRPFAASAAIIGTVGVRSASVVTSGIYERGFEHVGVWYHHILDPRTGMPAHTGLEAVTIISPLSADGDALSTVCFLLGEERAQQLVESLPDTEAIFVNTDGSVTHTSGIGHTVPFDPAQ